MNSQLTELHNGYEFVNGVEMHAELAARFQVPHPAMKKNVGVGHFVELRIDSPRFSVHEDAPEHCECVHCKEPMTKPVLCHEEPGSLINIPKQPVPSRGWGEQFWVQITARHGQLFQGRIDNTLYESRLHGLNEGDEITFHEDHILAVHGSHSQEIWLSMNEEELLEFGE